MKLISIMKSIYYELGIINNTTKNKEISERIYNDMISGYLTLNKDRDGQEYLWFYDGTNNICFNIRTGEYITDSIVISDLFE